MNQGRSSLSQAIRIVLVANWISLLLAILASATSERDPALSVAAAAMSALFVVAVTVIPQRRMADGGLRLELLLVAGALLTSAATTLTGGLESPYLLMALIPTLLAAIAGGHRMGLTTALLSAGLLAGVEGIKGGISGLATSAPIVALMPLLSVVVAQIRSILVDIEGRASFAEKASAQAEAELTRLGQANELLRRLTDLYGKANSNPVEVTRSSLEAIIDSKPSSFATATLFDTQGPVVVARIGTDLPELERIQIPLGDGDTTSGVVTLGTRGPLSEAERHEIDRLLRPVTVAFSNTLLLQNIAAVAVKEERLRLARELHDEVGPAMAALGLALDSAMLEAHEHRLREEVVGAREGLGGVVDDLRRIIADLRDEDFGSLTTAFAIATSEYDSPPHVEIDLQERRPPRSAAARQVAAIVIEAIRNAQRHAEAQNVKVTGFVDRTQIELQITDDGRGFDPSQLPEDRFGIMGMRERADRIGAKVEIDSGGEGTTVRVRWKERK